MIDFHTHILPAIDDGSKDPEQSYEMINRLAVQNIEAAVCTPHFDPSKIAMYDFLQNRNSARALLGDTRIPLLLASETKLHSYLFHYPDITPICIENTRYLLLELPFTSKWGEDVYAMIERILSYYEVIPIIVHVERYPAVKKNDKTITRLVHLGCIIQMNTSFLIDVKSRKKALHYIKNGYIDLLGSDCHNTDSRPPVFEEALTLIREHRGQEFLDLVEYKGYQVINGVNIRKTESFIVPPMQN